MFSQLDLRLRPSGSLAALWLLPMAGLLPLLWRLSLPPLVPFSLYLLFGWVWLSILGKQVILCRPTSIIRLYQQDRQFWAQRNNGQQQSLVIHPWSFVHTWLTVAWVRAEGHRRWEAVVITRLNVTSKSQWRRLRVLARFDYFATSLPRGKPQPP